jgi:succinate dehydrogenase / fumarate reductase, cytochrome b subunit
MPDINRGNRPLSPHLQVYKPQITTVLSILHRMTGVALGLGAMIVVWFFAAAASEDPDTLEIFNDVVTSWFGLFVLFGFTVALWYHTLNGIRHLFWDMGFGFKLDTMAKTGQAVLAGTVILTGFTWLIV